MRRAAWILVGVVSLAVALYASIFVIAEVATEVVVLRTYAADGSHHDTRLTVIDRDGTPWVRGRPYRGWFRRIEADPRAALRRGGRWHPVSASVSRDPEDAAAFDAIMFETYGRTYRYMDFVVRMSSNEIPVRLDPRVAGEPPC